MNQLFLRMINISIQASWLIMVVLILRVVLKKAPKWIHCLMWGIVALRLAVPFQIESVWSLLPSAEPVPMTIDRMSRPTVHMGIGAVDRAVNPMLAAQFTPDAAVSANPLQILIYMAAMIWLVGVGCLLFYALVSFLRLKKRVAAAVPVKRQVYLCDEIQSPFLFGIFRPVIYLPSDLPKEYYEPVLLHEQAHLRRGDHIWKPFGFLLLSIYWMNPLCWLAYILFCRDMELACDEKAVGDMDRSSRADYCQALLSCCTTRKMLAACPVAFGETGVKERVKRITRIKKPVFWVSALALIVCGIVAVCFLTSPKTESSDGNQSNQVSETEQGGAYSNLSWTRVNQWAQAFCDRDGATIASMATKEVQNALEEAGLLNINGDTASFGFSSPWPMRDEDTMPYWAIEMDVQNRTARILYYALTSDPHVTVWEEHLSFVVEGGICKVDQEQLTYHDSISTAEEYDAVYPVLSGTLMDYTVNGLGAVLADNGQGEQLTDPVQAARILLNLSEDPTEVSISMIQDSSSAGIPVSITFVKEQEEREVFMVKINDTIWVPQEKDTTTVENMDEWERMAEIFNQYVDDPIPWKEPQRLTEGEDALVQMAVDDTGRYKAYGVISKEYGDYGIAINDTIDGTDVNYNSFYLSWTYTGTSDDEPQFDWEGDQLYFTYPKEEIQPDGSTKVEHVTVSVDCGYDTGHVELN